MKKAITIILCLFALTNAYAQDTVSKAKPKTKSSIPIEKPTPDSILVRQITIPESLFQEFVVWFSYSNVPGNQIIEYKTFLYKNSVTGKQKIPTPKTK